MITKIACLNFYKSEDTFISPSSHDCSTGGGGAVSGFSDCCPYGDSDLKKTYLYVVHLKML